MSRELISVCMATYNGQKYLKEQIDSIISQLNHGDELIIVDDGSKDNTTLIILSYKDPRIKLFKNEKNGGHVFSFSKAISLAQNEIIVMADQDDVWIEGRLDKMVKQLNESKAMLLSSNSSFMDQDGNEIQYPFDPLKAEDSRKHFKNIFNVFIGKKSYFGCAMAFRKGLLSVILPIPKYVESHDLWIVFAANLMRSNTHIEVNTFIRRVHSENASIIQRSMSKKIYSRVVFVRALVELYRRITLPPPQ